MGQTHCNHKNRFFTVDMIEGAVTYIQWITMTLSLSYSHFRSLYLQLVQTTHPVALHIGYTLKTQSTLYYFTENSTVGLVQLYTVKLSKDT